MPATIAASRAFASGTKSAALPASPRFDRDRQHAFHRAHRAVQRQLADEAEVRRRVGSSNSSRRRDHPERDRQIEARSFFLNVGRREIDRRASARPMIAAVRDRRGDAVLAFFHRRVGQTDDDDVRRPPAALTSISTS